MVKILGIETSCDETAVAIVGADRTIYADLVASQLQQHKPYGGVVPEIAARAHLQLLPGMVERALADAKSTWNDISAIAVTAGPGLIGGLLTGTSLARAIAAVRKIPLYGLNHLEGHALTARLTHQVTFPYLLLLVSGGHSQFLLIENVGQYTRLGTTIDDAVGEAFDKVAKLLGFPYPGGPYVERAAQGGDGGRYKLPVPMLGRTGCDLSLSGLKTAVRHLVMEQPKPLGEKTIADIAASFQQAVGTMLANRAENAMEEFIRLYPKTSRALAVAGGVSANKYIAQKLEQAAAKYNFQIIVPPLNLCTDNAVMMAWAAIERHQAGIQNNPDFTARPRWPLDSRAAEMLSAAKA